MSAAKKAKVALLRIAKSAGAFSLVQNSDWRRRRLLILCYHGVSLADEHEWSPSFYLSPEQFETRMRALRDGGYSVLPLADALERLEDGTLPPRAVALTFDDGSADFALRAFPILERFGFPATVYLTTFYCGHPRPVFGVFCSYMLWKARARGRASKAVIGQAGEWEIASASGRQHALTEIRGYAEQAKLSTPEKDALAERLAASLDLDHADLVRRRLLQIMSPVEVDRLARAGVRFELHTHRHRTPLDRELFEREIHDNRERIESLTHRRASHFCYPSGVYEHAFLDWLRADGVRSATTCESGMAARSTDPLLLPRVVDGGQLNDLEFESWTTGIAQFLPRRVAHSPMR